MNPQTVTQGQNFYNPNTGRFEGVVQFDPNTGQRLGQGQTVNIPRSITPQSLQPATPLRLPTPSTGRSAGDMAYFQSLAEQYRQGEDKRIAELTAKTKESKSSYEDSILQYLDRGQEQLNLETEADIAGKRKAVDDYTSEIENLQRETLAQVKEIEKNKVGAWGGAVQDEINRVQRESLSKQADLTILKAGAERTLDRVQSTIDRKIALKYEPMKEKISFLREFYDNNKEDLSKAEQAQLSQRIKDEQRVFDRGVKEDDRAYNLFVKALENGLPVSQQSRILQALNSGDYGSVQQLVAPYLHKPKEQSALFQDAINWIYRQPGFTNSDLQQFNTDPSFRAWVLRQRELEKGNNTLANPFASTP